MIDVYYYPSPYPGHLAVVLSGLTKEKNIYISFYPNAKNSQFFFRLQSFIDDGPGVTQIASLPTRESCGYGLSETAIYDWWEREFHNKRPVKYGLLNKNCAQYVYTALTEGQEKSRSLGNKSMLEMDGYWPCTPDNVLDYSTRLAGIMLKDGLGTDPSIMRDLNKLREYCENKSLQPYDLVLATYSTFKQMPVKHDLMLRIPFCKAIRKALRHFLLNLASDIPPSLKEKLGEAVKVDDLDPADMHGHFNRLLELGNHIASLQPPVLGQMLERHMQNAISAAYTSHLSHILESYIKPYFNNPERIERNMKFIAGKLDDSKNPNKDFFSKASKQDLDCCLPRILGGGGD